MVASLLGGIPASRTLGTPCSLDSLRSLVRECESLLPLLTTVTGMRRLVLVGLVALVVVVIGWAVFVVRPGLADKRGAVDDRWQPVHEALLPRYDALSLLTNAVSVSSGAPREVVDQTRDALDRWTEADGAGAETQVRIANELEGLASRLAATVTSSSRLSMTPEVVTELERLTAAVVPPDASESYNDAVASYNDARSSLAGQPVASVFGFDARTAFASVR